MPELFIGTDIVSVPRVKKIIESSSGKKFINRIFTENEINYCDAQNDSFIHYAGRFSAKEAITKAILSSNHLCSIKMNSIEILSGKNRKPEVKLLLKTDLNHRCKVTISHTDQYAVAFAILEIY